MKKVLVVSYYWPPAGGTTMNRILRFIQYLPDYGWSVDVLTTNHASLPFEDSSLEKFIPKSTKVYRSNNINLIGILSKVFARNKVFIPYGFTQTGQDTIKSKILKYLKFNAVPDTRITWYPGAIDKGKKLCKQNNYDIIFSSSPPQTNHLIASKLSSEFDIPHIVDMRDPWSNVFWLKSQKYRLKIISNIDNKIESKILDKADVITTVTPNLKDFYKSKYGDKTSLIYNGYEKSYENFIQPRKTDKSFTICYSGSLSEDQNLDLFAEICSDFKSRIDKDIKLVFVGNYAPSLKLTLQKHGLGESLEVIPYTTMKNALDIIASADLLVVIGWKFADYGIIPSKIYDYILVDIPILGLDLHQDAMELVDELNIGKYFDDKSKVQASEYMMDVVSGNYTYKKNNKALQNYSRESQTQQLAQIFDDVWSRRHH